jgi:hypothetical protein
MKISFPAENMKNKINIDRTRKGGIQRRTSPNTTLQHKTIGKKPSRTPNMSQGIWANQGVTAEVV